MYQKLVLAGNLLLLMVAGIPTLAHAQKLVFVVRHAERSDGGGMQTQPQEDPALSAAGEARAEKLAWMLENSGIKAIYATEYRRTRDTAKPLAAKLGLTVLQTPSRDASALLGSLRSDHAADTVLVVGHSNTVPAIIKALGGPEIKISDTEYDGIYVIVPGQGTTVKIRF